MTNTMSAGGPSQLRPYPFKRSPPTPSGHDGEKVVTELKQVLSGTRANVFSRKDDQFIPASQIYNGAIECFAYAVVQPRNAEDVSKTVQFCRKNDLQLSVKAGGTGVHGQSIGGHIVLDMLLLNDIAVDLPDSGPTLNESFRNHVDSCSLTRATSGDSIPFVDAPQPMRKRSANDALGDDGGVGDMGRQKMDASGDVEMRSPTESSTPSSSTLWTRSNSTPGTSLSSAASKSSRQSSDPTYRVGRTTYVNPSPTTSSSFPYVPTSFGGASASASQHQSSFSNPLMSGQHPVLNINPDAPPYAIITFGTGVHSKQLDKVTSTSPYGAFHVPTSAFPVGAGQFLLGGFGFLGRMHGLAMDNVVEAEVVLADGRIVWLGAEGHQGDFKDGENPDDLWWAIRGAGSSFGVVTRLRAKAYYLPSVYAGNFIYKFNPATTPSLLRHVRDCVKGAPRSLYANIIMTAGPPGTPAIVAIQLCFSGSRSEGEQYVQNIGSWSEDRCLFQDFSERTFSRQQLAVEEVLRDGSGRKWYIKSDMLSSLDDDVIEKTCDRFPGVPNGCTWLFEYTGGGAVGDIKDSCLPAAHRDSQFTVAALHQWSHTEPKPLDESCVSTAEEWIREVIHPKSAGGPLPCFIQTPDEVPGAYGEAFPRLQAIKRTFDPSNFIKHAMWPGAPPISGEPEHEGDKDPYEDVKKGKQREISALPRTNGTGAVTPHDEAHKRTRLPSEATFLTDDIVLPDGQPTAGLDTPTPQIPSCIPEDGGLSQTRLEAIRSTPLSGVQEHRNNVPSQNMNIEEIVKAAASSA